MAEKSGENRGLVRIPTQFKMFYVWYYLCSVI